MRKKRVTMKLVSIYLLLLSMVTTDYLQAKMIPFMQAVVDGDYEVVKGFIKSDIANVNRQDGPDRSTALMLAARNGHVRIVALLLACGARLQLKDKKGRTALDYAKKGNHKQIIEMLIHQGVRSHGIVIPLLIIK